MSLLLQAIIILSASLMIVPMFKRMGINSMFGYLLTGILLGSNALNLIHQDEILHYIFEFTILFLVFFMGLELRPQRILHLGQSIFSYAPIQVIGTGFIFTSILFFAFSQSFSSSFVIGFALAFSSTIFALQYLESRQQSNSILGQTIYPILLFQTIAAMILIAALPILAGGESAHHGIAYFAAVISAFTGLYLFSRYLIKPFFKAILQNSASEFIVIITLFITLSTIFLMDVLGINLILGAFLAGILLADSNIQYEIKTHLEPFKKPLLGLFFLLIGLTTPLAPLLAAPEWIIGGVLLLIIIKFTIFVAISRYLKHSWQNGLLLAGSLFQSGEIAFVIFHVAQQEQLINIELAQTLTLVVLLSIILTPCIYWIIQRYLNASMQNKNIQPNIPQDHPSLIIAGFGRMGQVIARIAHIQNIRFTVIDNTLVHAEFVEKFGGVFCHGDASDTHTLQLSGIEHAQVFIIAIDDIEDAMNLARHIRLNYPNLKIVVRARDRHHVHLLREMGITQVWRETYLSALGMALATLKDLGVEPKQAHQCIEHFRQHDETILMQQQRLNSSDQKAFESYENTLTELEYLFERDYEMCEILDHTDENKPSSTHPLDDQTR